MHPTLTEQQLEELRPLAAVIEAAIKDTPIRLGTDDWGTVLAATVLARVAAYMGGVVRPVASGPAADEDAQRATRRASLGHLLGRAERGALVSPKEGALLRQHVEAALRLSDQLAAGRATWKAKAEEIERDRDRLAAELRRMADEAQQPAMPDVDTLAAALDGLHTLIATSSRDWQTYRVDAWLWAVLCGWDCEQAEHDDTCTHGALEETAAMHGWDDATVAKARRYRAAVRILTGPAIQAQQPAQDILCPEAFWLRRPEAPHDWQQRPDAQPVHCPGVAEAQQPKEA